MAAALRAISCRDRAMASWARCWMLVVLSPDPRRSPFNPGLPLVGEVFPLIGPGLPLVGEVLPLIGPGLAVIGRGLPRIGQAVTVLGGALPGPAICVAGPGLTAG